MNLHRGLCPPPFPMASWKARIPLPLRPPVRPVIAVAFLAFTGRRHSIEPPNRVQRRRSVRSILTVVRFRVTPDFTQILHPEHVSGASDKTRFLPGSCQSWAACAPFSKGTCWKQDPKTRPSSSSSIAMTPTISATPAGWQMLH